MKNRFTHLMLAACTFTLCAFPPATAAAQETEAATEAVQETEAATEAAQETEAATEAVQANPFGTKVYINGNEVFFDRDNQTELSMLSVENGITVQVEKEGDEQVVVNGEEVEDSVHLDIARITRDSALEIVISDGEAETTQTVSLMPSSFLDYTTEGEATSEGDFLITSYDELVNYMFKLNNQGDLIFYKAITKTDEQGNTVSTNGLDFRKQYTSDGEVRYTYNPYLADAFADGDCTGINPGCVVVMDENYNVLEELYYKDENGDDVMIDPHGFIWLDEGHYILTAYKQEVLDVPEDLGSKKNKADLAVLYIEEIKDDEVLWEFRSADYEKFLYESNSINWKKAAKKCQDYMHFNSMFIDTDGNLLVSCRHLDSILKISREDGSLMWQLGGAYGDFALADDQKFSYQHSIIVTDDGSYMLFDNANTAVQDGKAQYSSVIRMTVDEENKTITDFTRYNVVDFFSIYMGGIRQLDSANSVYLWAVGGNYQTDKDVPPEWSMVEYRETPEGGITRDFCFRFNEGTRRLYCANKCK